MSSSSTNGPSSAGRRRTGRTHNAEDETLSQIAKEAEARLAQKRAARIEAREIRMRELERQQREAQDKTERDWDDKSARTQLLNSRATSVASSGSYGSQSYTPGTSKNEVFTDGGDADKSSLSVNELKGALSEIEDKYRRAMLQIAQLDNERTQLSYQSQQLQDLLEEQEEELYRVKKEHKKSCQEVEHQKQINYGLQKKIGDLQESLRQRDELIQEQGLVLIGDDGGSSYNSDPVALVSPEVAKLLEEAGEGPLDVRLRHLVEEKRDLEDQVRRLSDEIAEERNNRHNNHYESDVTENGLTEMQLLEVQREANRQVNEYKLKLQKSEQDLAAYHGNITRLESQLQRFKQTSEFYEKNEDEMRAEKRKLMRDLRTALDRIEEMEMTNSHLEKRLERIRASRTAISSQS